MQYADDIRMTFRDPNHKQIHQMFKRSRCIAFHLQKPMEHASILEA